MLVRIISGIYGYRPIQPDGTRSHHVIPVRAGEPPIDVKSAEGERLIGLGIAEAATAGEDADLKAEAPEGPSEAKTEGTRLEDMSFNKLKALARENGIAVGGVRSKAGLIEAIAGGSEAPKFEAQDVVD